MTKTATGANYGNAPFQEGVEPAFNAFDRAEGFISTLFAMVFAITGMVSSFATYIGIRIYLEESGATNLLANGMSVILTIATGAILIVGWSVISRYGGDARGPILKVCMLGLGAALLAITLSVSSLSNLMALVGPGAKMHDWRLTHQIQTEIVAQLEVNALGAKQVIPSWRAEAAKACPAAEDEADGGVVSGTGRGTGPVAFALNGVCQQTLAFVTSMEDAIDETNAAVAEARAALALMRAVARDRDNPVIVREDNFLVAGDALIVALQRLRAADLTGVLDAGAKQIRASVAELSVDSAFTPKQVETISNIRNGIEGLILSTDIILERQRSNPVPDLQPILSPDYIEGVVKHAGRFIPVFAAAIGIDLFALWAMLFMLVSKAGRPSSARQ